MKTYDMGYEQACEEIEGLFGNTSEGDPLPLDQYKANLISWIEMKRDIDEIWKKGIFDLEDIVLEDWAERRKEII